MQVPIVRLVRLLSLALRSPRMALTLGLPVRHCARNVEGEEGTPRLRAPLTIAVSRRQTQLIRGLEAARGNGTSMISLIMHPRDQVGSSGAPARLSVLTERAADPEGGEDAGRRVRHSVEHQEQSEPTGERRAGGGSSVPALTRRRPSPCWALSRPRSSA